MKDLGVSWREMKDSGKKGSRTIETPGKRIRGFTVGLLQAVFVCTYSLTPTLRQAYLLLLQLSIPEKKLIIRTLIRYYLFLCCLFP